MYHKLYLAQVEVSGGFFGQDRGGRVSESETLIGQDMFGQCRGGKLSV